MRTNKPLVGISPSIFNGKTLKMNVAYENAIFSSGGIPIFLPYTEDPEILDMYVRDCDAFLFAGGVDVDPKHYGEAVSADNVEILPERDAFELALFARIYPTKKPILGICRGAQLINVAMGGSLYQDIPNHSQKEPGSLGTQHIRISEESTLSSVLGTSETFVNTFHHQAIKRVADGLTVTAYADDKIPEAVEDMRDGRFLLALQWHPELMAGLIPEQADIFKAFIKAIK